MTMPQRRKVYIILPACCFFLRFTEAEIKSTNSSSVELLRIASRSDTSVLPKRHTFKLPSAVIRKRLHEPQKCSDIDVIKPIWPTKFGTLYAFEVSFSPFGKASMSGYFFLIIVNISLKRKSALSLFL